MFVLSFPLHYPGCTQVDCDKDLLTEQSSHISYFFYIKHLGSLHLHRMGNIESIVGKLSAYMFYTLIGRQNDLMSINAETQNTCI